MTRSSRRERKVCPRGAIFPGENCAGVENSFVSRCPIANARRTALEFIAHCAPRILIFLKLRQFLPTSNIARMSHDRGETRTKPFLLRLKNGARFIPPPPPPSARTHRSPRDTVKSELTELRSRLRWLRFGQRDLSFPFCRLHGKTRRLRRTRRLQRTSAGECGVGGKVTRPETAKAT